MSWKRAGIAMLVGIPLLMLLAWGMVRGDPRIIPSPLIGQPAPDFELPVMALTRTPDGEDVTGETVRLSDHLGDVVVLNFYASWCVPCRIEHPALVRTAARYAGSGRPFLRRRVPGHAGGRSGGTCVRWVRRAIRACWTRGSGWPSTGAWRVCRRRSSSAGWPVSKKVFSAISEQELVSEIETAAGRAGARGADGPHTGGGILKRLLIVLVAAGAGGPAVPLLAQEAQPEGLYVGQGRLEDPAQEARASRLASELQCPVCQGQSIALRRRPWPGR
jgi:thiol-disulfide isomerase/thioredoxin